LVHIVNDAIVDAGFGSGVYATDALEVLRKMGRNILDAAEATARRDGVKTNSTLLESVGAPASDLILNEAKAWSADVVVMGTHGRRGLARLVMGSDAESVVRACTVPVLLVRGQTKQKTVAPRVGAAVTIRDRTA